MIGETIGRYRVDAELGRGGMGVVYRATQTTLDRTVAIKMLSPQFAGSSEHLSRFRREAEVLARLQHENIVHIYDVEEVAGSFCIVMEYVAGPSLGQLLAQSPTLPPATVRDIGARLASGLEAAHRKGVVHRDLKPDNILFTPDGRPRITDFGIARIAGGSAMDRTRTGVLMGTPYYMSPEQAGGGEITGASDLYSLGVLLYQMLSGRVPFDGADPISLAIKHMQEPVPELATTMPGLPGDLVRIVSCALEKEPHRRFSSAAEMKAALASLELAAAPHTLEDLVQREPVSQSETVACPDCGFEVHDAFVTCPKCGHPLRSGGSLPHRPSEPALFWLHQWQAWTRPRGRWRVPLVLWAGVGILAVALTAGLLDGGPGGQSAADSHAPGLGGGSRVTAGGSTGPSGGGGVPPLPAPSTTTSPSSAEPAPGGRLPAGPGSSEDEIADEPGPSEPAPAPARSIEGIEDVDEVEDIAGVEGMAGVEGIENLPDSFDIERARRELVAVVERQRRATESGDGALFVRDLTPELAISAADDLDTLHAEWSAVRSELWNVRIRFEDGTRAHVDFHTRLVGTPRGGGREEVIQDTHVYWTLSLRDDRWWIVEAFGEAHRDQEP